MSTLAVVMAALVAGNAPEKVSTETKQALGWAKLRDCIRVEPVAEADRPRRKPPQGT
jgi:hypothetical protein